MSMFGGYIFNVILIELKEIGDARWNGSVHKMPFKQDLKPESIKNNN